MTQGFQLQVDQLKEFTLISSQMMIDNYAMVLCFILMWQGKGGNVYNLTVEYSLQ